MYSTCPNSKLQDPQEALLQEVRFLCELYFSNLPAQSQGSLSEMNAEKAEVGKQVAKQKVLATIHNATLLLTNVFSAGGI